MNKILRLLPARTGLVAIVCLACAGWLSAAEVMPPAPTRYFNDYAGVTQPGVADQLNRKLEQFEKDTSSQLVVAVFPKMQSDSSLEDYANRMFRAWKIGQKGKNNGALLVVFVQDRKLHIEVGYGLEAVIPDATAKRINAEQITPRFKAGDYNGGLSAGVNALMQAARGEYKGTGRTVDQQRRGSGGGGLPFVFFLLIFGFFGFAIFMSILQRAFRGSVYRRGGYSSWGAFPTIWTSGGGGGGWSGGGGGGGGFSGGGFSGGGGDSGGGGASGSW